MVSEIHNGMKIIFIVGASRSGTTMLNRIMGNHDEIMALNELHYFGDIFDISLSDSPLSIARLETMCAKLLARNAHGIWGNAPTNHELEIASSIVSKLGPRQLNGMDLFSETMRGVADTNNKTIVTEQTPRNIFYASTILDYFPDAYVINLVRDPRAVLASQKGRWRRKWLGGSNIPWAEILRVWVNYHPVTMCKLWKKSVDISLTLSDHPRFHTIKFEELVGSPEDQIQNICKLIGVDFQSNMLMIPHVGSSNKLNTKETIGISAEVLGAWKNKLNAGEISLCERITSRQMEHYNYLPATKKMPVISILASFITFPFHVFAVMLINPRRTLTQIRAYIRK